MENLTIGQRIASRRKALGLSQIALGEEMGVSRQSISKWESDAAIPEIDKLIALSKLFGVSVGWLLGVEESPAQEENAETEFSDREWALIDQLSQPRLPKWLVPLTAGAAALSLAAAVLAGAALYATRNRKTDLAAISQAVADLAVSTGGTLSSGQLLKDYQFLAQPSADLAECTFQFSGWPSYYEEGAAAELLIVHNGEALVQEECQWDGTCYRAEFTVPVQDGYTALFNLTSDRGIVRSSRVVDAVLYNLQDSQVFGQISMEYGSLTYDGSSLHLRDIHFVIDAPDILRDTEDIWAGCDLVVLGDGQELGRLDLLNRSAYSRQVNFSANDVDFYTQAQSVETGSISGYEQIELMLECRFSSGLLMQKVLKTIAPARLTPTA